MIGFEMDKELFLQQSSIFNIQCLCFFSCQRRVLRSQCSILGLLFFSALHQRYNQRIRTILQPILFVDDTNVFLFSKDKDCLSNILNTELNKLAIWFRVNRLFLFIVFKLCQKRTNRTIFCVRTWHGSTEELLG